MSIFNKLFGKQDKKQPSRHPNQKKPIPTFDEFTRLRAENRLGVIMVVGDTGKSEYFPFLKYAILNDPDFHVTLAALKRIHLFKENTEVVPMLTEIKNNGSGQEFEPYFSMALSRLGIITMEEFEKKMNNAE
ncbi:hypothetical protein [uncultured Fluviicola sp.]|uniref:hypothetical protein n=1 Tax=uncultured Fluviicola sp. TaxID=463303 RepID=UPI0025D63A5F|nr:hypothetical protein [uncultured Fluviicola sp.]